MRQRFRTFIALLFVALAVNGVIYGGILWYRSLVVKKIQGIQAGVKDLDALIADAEKSVVPALRLQKLAELSVSLLDQHRHWVKLLELLEERSMLEVQFANLTGVDTGQVTADLRAKDYTTLARQVVALREDPRVRSVEIGTAAAELGEGGVLLGVRTTVSMAFDPRLLLGSNCGRDGACAEYLLSNCKSGSFRTGIPGVSEMEFTVPEGGACVVIQRLLAADRPERIGPTMTCPFEPGIGTVEGLLSHLSGLRAGGYRDCGGPLKELLMR
jgi:hypothetical protein